MGITAGGHSNFRCSCDNCAEPGHHLSGLWASSSSGKPETFCLCCTNIAISAQFLSGSLLTGNPLNSALFFLCLTPHGRPRPDLSCFANGSSVVWCRGYREGCCDGIGNEESVDPCYGNNLFASSPSGLLHNAPDFHSVLARALWRMLAADSGEALGYFLID